jgi:hypothetical protein
MENTNKVHLGYSVRYRYEGSSRHPYIASITFYLEANEKGRVVPPLRSATQSLLCQPLGDEWGESTFSTIFGCTSWRHREWALASDKGWADVSDKAHSLIAESIRTIKEVKRKYDESVATILPEYSSDLYI